MALKTVDIVGAPICNVSLEEAIETIERFVASRGHHYVCFNNVHTVITCRKDAEFRRATREADLALPDGVPLVWALNLMGYEQKTRVYGPDAMLVLCERSVRKGYSHFFYGGEEGVPDALAERLRARYPGLKVAGWYSPPFRPLTAQEDEEVVDAINRSKADFLWVGLGAPKQEKWMLKHLGQIRVPVMLGVGAAFDFHSGRIKQAPGWMQKVGLEWFFRLCMEPRRLWKRYLYNNPAFLFLFARQLMTRHRES